MTPVTFRFPEAYLSTNGQDQLSYIEITVNCFLGVYPNFYKEFGVDGYIGLAPLLAQYSQYSFPAQISNILRSSNMMAINFDITRNENFLSIYEGQLVFIPTDQIDFPNHSKRVFNLTVPQNRKPFSLTSVSYSTYLNNTFEIEVPNFFSTVNIQGFKSYQTSNISAW